MSKNPKSVEEMTLEEMAKEVDGLTERAKQLYATLLVGDRITLDTVAALMPPLWKWEKFDGGWWAWIPGVHTSGPEVYVPITSDEKLDRFRLLLLILRKESNV